MTTNSDSGNEWREIAEQAAAWRVTLGAHDATRVPEFWNWVTRSPLHVREALLMGLLNQALQDLDREGLMHADVAHSSDVDGVGGQYDLPEPETVRKGRLNRWIFSAAAIAACLALGLVSVFLFRSPNQIWLPSETYTTGVGEQRTIALKDGSTVVLDAQSQLRVQLSARERSLYLDGQALFSVAHDPSRPFRVRTSATTVEAIGTEFNVRTQSVTTVAVLNGVVSLYSQGTGNPWSRGHAGSSTAPAKLAAGEAASINGNGEITERTKVDRATVTAWEQRRLVFSRVPLENIVREFNRYSLKQRMRVEGNAASLRFGGVFDASDPAPLLFLLAKNHSIILERNGDDVIIRDRP
jgi:transmembrane sensor